MKLLTLSALVCNLFSAAAVGEMRTVQKVKDHQLRDVVTSLDKSLHDLAANFVDTRMPGCKIMSEEGAPINGGTCLLGKGEWLVVDPLDGSNNYALSMPGFGFMAAYVVEGKVSGTVVVLPEHDLYFVAEGSDILISQSFSVEKSQDTATVYYAYPPKLSDAALNSRTGLFNMIDQHTSGVYRYGSACIGLFNLIRGRHASFVGHGIRIWDALAYFPLLENFGISAKYQIGEAGLNLIASKDTAFIKEACDVISLNENINFSDLVYNNKLKISS